MTDGDLNPCRVDPDGLDAALADYQLLNWGVEGDGLKIPKQPAAPSRNAKSNDAGTWGSFDDALANALEDDDLGIGFPCAQANPFLFVDIDIPDGGDWVPDYDRLGGAVVERSPSGNHRAILRGVSVPDWWTNQSDPGKDTREVKLFDDSGYVTLTGDVIDGYGPPLEDTHQPAVDGWLKDVWRVFNPDADEGDEPWVDAPEEGDSPPSGGRGQAARSDEWMTEADVRDALEEIDPDVDYDTWRDIGFALVDFFDSRATARSVFEDWSRGGTKWDDDAPDRAEGIIDGADATAPPNGVHIGTVVRLAKVGGWDPSNAPSAGTGGARATADGGTAAASPSEGGAPDDDAPDGWEVVRRLYLSSDAGTTAEANYHAVQQLRDEAAFLTPTDTDDLYRYDDEVGVYEDDGETTVRNRLSEVLGAAYSRSRVDEILHRLRSATYVDRDSIDDLEGEIPVANGILDADTRERRPITPDDRLTRTIGTEYDPDADCPRFRAFLEDVTTSERDRRLLQEYVGYTLLHWDLPFHKHLFLVGPKRAGKSTFLDTVLALLGDDVTISTDLQQLTNSRFHSYRLEGAWANAANDIPSTLIESAGKFKAIMAGDRLTVEPKGKAPFEIQPTTKHLFSANQLPSAKDEDPAFFSRVILVSFPTTVPAEERDEELDGKLAAELPGILNWALDGLDRLRDRGAFFPPAVDAAEETHEMWDRFGDSIKRFKNAALEKQVDGKAAKADVYDAYTRFCDDEGLPAESQRKLTRELKKDKDIGDGARVDRQRAFTGITIREDRLPQPDDRDADQGGLDGY